MVLVALGSLAILLGGLDLFNGTYFIVPGSGMIALGAYLGQTPGRKLVYCAFLLVAGSRLAVWNISFLFDGVTGWWQVVHVLYMMGWLMDLVGVPYMLTGWFKEGAGVLVVMIWAMAAIPLVWLVYSGTSRYVTKQFVGVNGGFEIEKDGLPVNWGAYTPEGAKSSLDTAEHVEGKQSLKIVVDRVGERSPTLGLILDPVKTRPHKVSFWLKNQGCTIDVSIQGTVCHDLWAPSEAEVRDVAAHPPIKKTLSNEETGADTWRQFEYIYDVPKTDGSIYLILFIKTPGTLWIDDVRIEEAQKAPGANASAETPVTSNPQTPAQPNPTTEKEIIEGLFKDHMAALKAGDIERVMFLYSENFRLSPNPGGKKEMRAFWELLNANACLPSMEADMKDYKLTVTGDNAAGGPFVFRNVCKSYPCTSLIWHKEEDGWKIVAASFHEGQPL